MTTTSGDDRGCLAAVKSLAKCRNPCGKALRLSIRAPCKQHASVKKTVGSHVRRHWLSDRLGSEAKSFVVSSLNLFTDSLIKREAADKGHEYSRFSRDVGAEVP